MPRTTLTAPIPGGGVDRPPMVKMTSKGEVQRLALWDVMVQPDGSREISPWSEWVHRIEAPEIKDGMALQVRHEKKDGTFEMRWSMTWISSHICLGDQSIMAQKGMDPDGCPTCEAVRRNKALGRWAAELRYAMNVIQYSLRPGSYELMRPVGASVIVWGFPVSRYRALRELARKVAVDTLADGRGGTRPKSLMDVDIVLGPCEDPGKQRYDIDRIEPAGWRDPEVFAYLKELWLDHPENLFGEDSLQAACGKLQTNRAYLEADIAKGENAWNIALNAGQATATDPMAAAFQGAQGLADMSRGLDALAAQAAQGAPAPAGTAVPVAAAPAQPAPVMDPFAAPAAQAAGAPAAPAIQDPFGGHGMDQFAPQAAAQPAPAAPVAAPAIQDPFAAMQPTAAVPPTAASPAPVASPAAQPATPSAPPQAAPSPAPASAAPADPFAVQPAQAPQGTSGAVSFEELTQFGQQ